MTSTNIKALIAIFLFSLLGFSQAFAQIFTSYYVADGLLSDNVNCVAIDKDDNVWFGTQAGISVFDQDSQWWHHTTSTDTGLVDDAILTITVTSTEDVWVGTDFGVSVYDGTSWKTYTEADGLGDDRVFYIREDNSGNMWIGHSEGVSRFDGTNWDTWTMADGLPFGGVSCMDFHPNGDIYFGTKLGGIQVFDGNNFSGITESEGLLNDKVKSLAIDAQGNKWVATTSGVSVFDDQDQLTANHTRMYIMPPPDTLNPTEDVQINSKGQVWTGVFVDYLITVGGVCAFAGNFWSDYDVSDGVAGPVIRRLAIDADDHVWVTTSTGVTEISDIGSLGIGQMTLENGYRVYPNPAKDILHIERSEGEEFGSDRVIIYNALMQEVSTSPILRGQSSLDISVNWFAPGLYMVRIGT